MQGSRGIPETFAEKWGMQLFVLQRENKINTSDTFTKPNIGYTTPTSGFSVSLNCRSVTDFYHRSLINCVDSSLRSTV